MEVSIKCRDRDVLSAEISPPRKTDDVQIRGRLTRELPCALKRLINLSLQIILSIWTSSLADRSLIFSRVRDV